MTYEDFEREVKEIISDYEFIRICAVARKRLKGLKFTSLEEKDLYQEFREKAVEQFPDEDWEWVHREYDKIYEEYMGAYAPISIRPFTSAHPYPRKGVYP